MPWIDRRGARGTPRQATRLVRPRHNVAVETAKEITFYGWIVLACLLTIQQVLKQMDRQMRRGEEPWKLLLVWPFIAPLLCLMILLYLSPLWAIARSVIWLLEWVKG